MTKSVINPKSKMHVKMDNHSWRKISLPCAIASMKIILPTSLVYQTEKYVMQNHGTSNI